MSKMSVIHQTITDYLEQGDNVYRIASVLDVPLSWVQEIAKEVGIAESTTGWYLMFGDTKIYQEFPNNSFKETVCLN